MNLTSNFSHKVNPYINYLGDFGNIYMPYAILSVVGVLIGTLGTLNWKYSINIEI